MSEENRSKNETKPMISIPLDYKPLSVGNVGGAVKTKLPKKLPVQRQIEASDLYAGHTLPSIHCNPIA